MISKIDELLAKSFEVEFEKNVGPDIKKLIKKRLLEKHGIPLSEGIKNFEKFEDVLSEIFYDGYKGVIQHWLEKICVVNKTNDLEIKHNELRKQILESYDNLKLNSKYNQLILKPYNTSKMMQY